MSYHLGTGARFAEFLYSVISSTDHIMTIVIATIMTIILPKTKPCWVYLWILYAHIHTISRWLYLQSSSLCHCWFMPGMTKVMTVIIMRINSNSRVLSLCYSWDAAIWLNLGSGRSKDSALEGLLRFKEKKEELKLQVSWKQQGRSMPSFKRHLLQQLFTGCHAASFEAWLDMPAHLRPAPSPTDMGCDLGSTYGWCG